MLEKLILRKHVSWRNDRLGSEQRGERFGGGMNPLGVVGNGVVIGVLWVLKDFYLTIKKIHNPIFLYARMGI